METVLETLLSTLEAPELRADRFRISDAGRCPRMRILKRLGIAECNPPDHATLYRFQFGHIYHQEIQRRLLEAGYLIACEQPVGNQHFLGHPDGRTWNGEIVEIKTMNPFSYRKALKTTVQEDPVLRRYALQLMTYCYFEGASRGRLVLASLSPSYDREPPVHEITLAMNDWLPAVKDDMENVVRPWEERRLPPCTCGDESTFWQQACPYWRGFDCCLPDFSWPEEESHE